MAQTDNTYAEALFEVASELGCVHEYLDELTKVNEVLSDEADYVRLLDAPSVPLKERTDLVSDAFGDTLPEHILSFLNILCEKGLVHTFFDIYAQFGEMVRFMDGEVFCKVTSAVELTPEEKNTLCTALEKRLSKKATVQFIVDPSVLGGVIIEADGMVYDGTLRRKLIDMKDVIKG